MEKKVLITTDFIKLDSFLKFAGAADTGGEAKKLIQQGNVYVNGEICTMRGKKIIPGDTVRLRNICYTVGREDAY